MDSKVLKIQVKPVNVRKSRLDKRRWLTMLRI
jgi:hypothetical protein